MLADLDLRSDYRSGRDALLNDFYIPCLQESSTYDRAVGYFSSALIYATATAYSDFAQRKGRMRLICSPALIRNDYDAMVDGEARRGIAQGAIDEELVEILRYPMAAPAAVLLGTLVAADLLEVRIAFSDDDDGIFHEKLGIFTDDTGRRVSFVGSINETFAAWTRNQEAFDAFGSWWGESELLRTRHHASNFEHLWAGDDPGARTCAVSQITRDRLREFEADSVESAIEQYRMAHEPKRRGRRLFPHQRDVLASWEANSYRGIVNFATGAGKTLTAIEAVRRWTQHGHPAIILVPGKELHRQWAIELRKDFPEAVVLRAGAGANVPEWEKLLPAFTKDSSPGSVASIILVTNATFATANFQSRLTNAGSVLLVADEVHRTGSPSVLAALLNTPAAATLGLSATYERKFDADGTTSLLQYYGPVLEPVIGLAEAIAAGMLVPYDYYLHTLRLEDDEYAKYQDFTERIRRLSGFAEGDAGHPDQSHLRMLLIQRARILKQARGKVGLALEVLHDEYRDGDRWLVYCDDMVQLGHVVEGCLAMGLPALEFHSGMIGDRDAVLESLRSVGGVVVAIRCLDEGVDIPAADKALILASSTIEREYIQRRGRVLRRSDEKLSASVHDLLLVDDGGGALTRGEAVRALEFSTLARNRASREQLRVLIALSNDAVSQRLDEILELTEDEE